MLAYQINAYKKHINAHSDIMSGLIVYFCVFIFFFTFLYTGHVCLAETSEMQRWAHQPGQKFYWSRQVALIGSENKDIVLTVAVIENRFIAKGTITDIQRASNGMQKFTLQIKKVEQVDDYPNFGSNYLGKKVEIFSEIGIPSSFQIGAEVSVVLRVSGDEWGQYLFLVEVIDNGTKN